MNSISFERRTDSRTRIAFAFATAMFFLMCHGLLGASHALGAVALPADAPSDGAKSHQIHGTHAADEPDGTTPHKSDSGLMYASVIVVLAFGAFIFSSFVRTRTCFRLVTSHRGRGDLIFLKGLIPCRGPTLPALQVFRL